MLQSRHMASVALLMMAVMWPTANGVTAILDPEEMGPEISGPDLDGIFTCVRRVYSFKVSQQDHLGRTCSDVVTVMSCWGRCDSNEVSSIQISFFKNEFSFNLTEMCLWQLEVTQGHPL